MCIRDRLSPPRAPVAAAFVCPPAPAPPRSLFTPAEGGAFGRLSRLSSASSGPRSLSATSSSPLIERMSSLVETSESHSGASPRNSSSGEPSRPFPGAPTPLGTGRSKSLYLPGMHAKKGSPSKGMSSKGSPSGVKKTPVRTSPRSAKSPPGLLTGERDGTEGKAILVDPTSYGRTAAVARALGGLSAKAAGKRPAA